LIALIPGCFPNKVSAGMFQCKISKDLIRLQPIFPIRTKYGGYHILWPAFRHLEFEFIEYLTLREICVICWF
jgi:hypothetical protein